MEANPVLEVAVDNAKIWMRDGVSQIYGRDCGKGLRDGLCVAFQHLALEHFDAILRLVDGQVYGSAFALYRPQFDAFVRGVFFRIKASDKHVERFQMGAYEPPRIHDLVRNIDGGEGYRKGDLIRMKDEIYDTLCDFTHGGSIQIRSRLNGGVVEARFPLKYVAALVRSSTHLSLLCCLEIARLAQDGDLAGRLRDVHRRLWGLVPDA